MASLRTDTNILHISSTTFTNKRYGFNDFYSNSMPGVTDSSLELKITALIFRGIWLLS